MNDFQETLNELNIVVHVLPTVFDRKLDGRLLDLYLAVKDHGWISGSYATWLAAENAPAPGDIDIFCKTIESFPQLERNLNAVGFKAINYSEFSVTFEDSRNSDEYEEVLVLPVQLVYARPLAGLLEDDEIDPLARYGETPEALTKNFDLSIAQAVVIAPDKVWVSLDWLLDMPLRNVTVVNKLTPVHTAMRLAKYKAKGYDFEQGEMRSLFDAWASLTDKQRELQFYI